MGDGHRWQIFAAAVGPLQHAIAHDHVPGQVVAVRQKIRKQVIVIPLAGIGWRAVTRSDLTGNGTPEVSLRSHFLQKKGQSGEQAIGIIGRHPRRSRGVRLKTKTAVQGTKLSPHSWSAAGIHTIDWPLIAKIADRTAQRVPRTPGSSNAFDGRAESPNKPSNGCFTYPQSVGTGATRKRPLRLEEQCQLARIWNWSCHLVK